MRKRRRQGERGGETRGKVTQHKHTKEKTRGKKARQKKRERGRSEAERAEAGEEVGEEEEDIHAHTGTLLHTNKPFSPCPSKISIWSGGISPIETEKFSGPVGMSSPVASPNGCENRANGTASQSDRTFTRLERRSCSDSGAAAPIKAVTFSAHFSYVMVPMLESPWSLKCKVALRT